MFLVLRLNREIHQMKGRADLRSVYSSHETASLKPA